jgi:hypothetical protein
MSDLKALEAELAALREAEKARIERRVFDPIAAADVRAQASRMRELERGIARERGEEYADLLPACPRVKPFGEHYLVSVGHTVHVICEKLGGAIETAPVLAFRFSRCVGTRFEAITDDLYELHPLFGNGLEVTGCFIIRESQWLHTLMQVLSKHTAFDPRLSSDVRHFLLRLKAGDLSVLAADVAVEERNVSMLEIRRMFQGLTEPR